MVQKVLFLVVVLFMFSCSQTTSNQILCSAQELNDSKVISIHHKKGDFIVYSEYKEVDEKSNDSSLFYVSFKENQMLLFDKVGDRLNVSFCDNEMLINTLDVRPEYYSPLYDDFIWIFKIDSLKKGVLSKDSIYCKHCISSYKVGDKLFFSKSIERDDFYGGYAWTNIYVATNKDLSDSMKIATMSKIKAVSLDGKFIFAEVCDIDSLFIIIDVGTKKFSYVENSNYSGQDVYYSIRKNKFCFTLNENEFDLDIPNNFPFDALERDR